MALTRMTDDVENITKLDNQPSDNSGFSPGALKSAFDRAGADIKTYGADSSLLTANVTAEVYV